MLDKPRVVVVTGASSGLGKSMANYLHDSGYRVYGTSRRAPEGRNPHGDFALIKMDVTDDASVATGIEMIVSVEGRLDAIVSNAGMGIAGSVEDTSSLEAHEQFETNFFGTHRLVKFALPHLRKAASSHIIVIGSLAGLFGVPFQGMYCASKFALEGYCEALRIELRKTPVRVTVLEPGDFATGFTGARLMVAASGPQSTYHDAFHHALKIIEREEIDGADPILLGHAVREILETDAPPIRKAVVGDAQKKIARAKYDLTPEQLEDMLASWFTAA